VQQGRGLQRLSSQLKRPGAGVQGIHQQGPAACQDGEDRHHVGTAEGQDSGVPTLVGEQERKFLHARPPQEQAVRPSFWRTSAMVSRASSRTRRADSCRISQTCEGLAASSTRRSRMGARVATMSWPKVSLSSL